MLTAAALAVTLAAAPTPMPPMVVHVATAADITPTLVAAVLAEADAIWRSTGIAFLWQRDSPEHVPSRARAAAEPPYRLSMLRLVIGHDTHVRDGTHIPLGWIVFDDPSTPEREIYVSYDNASTLL